jgi:hypothetical protein
MTNEDDDRDVENYDERKKRDETIKSISNIGNFFAANRIIGKDLSFS